MGFREYIKRKEEGEDTSFGKGLQKANQKNKAAAKLASANAKWKSATKGFDPNKVDFSDLSKTKIVNSGQTSTSGIVNMTSAGDVAKSNMVTKGAVDKATTSAGKGVSGDQLQGALAIGDATGLTNDGSTEGGAAGGALAGAAMGAKFGPYGAAVGAVLGGISGGLEANAAKKAEKESLKAKAEAQHQGNLGNIERERAAKEKNAMATMKQAFSKNLNDNKKVKL